MRKTLLVLSVVLFSYHFICAQDLDPLLKRKLTNEQLEQLKLAEEKSNSQKSYHFLINSAADSKSYGNEPDWRWKSKIGGSGDDYCKGIATDSEGNMYFVGSFCGELSVGSETLKTTGDREAIITKFNNSGELLWIKQIEASTGEKTEAFDITVDQSNNIYVTGYYSGSIDVGAFNLPDQAEYNLYVIKLNTSGDYLMAVHYGDEGEYRIGLKMDIDNNGNIYIVGSTQTKTGWRHESIILKYDSNCTLLWEQLHDESINDIKVGETHAYFVGVVEGSYNDGFIDDNVTLNSSNYISNAFILKSDLSGDFKWGVTAAHVNLMESSYGERLDIDSEENIFMVGFFKEQVDFGGNILTDATTGYITKCDSSGNFQWAKKTTSNIEDVAVNNENEIVVLSQEITRFDNTGNTLWTKKTNLSTGSIYTDNSNNILAVGTENGMILIIKYNTSGVNSWHYQFEGNSARGDVIGMVADSIGNLYTYGYASNDIEFFGESINSGLFLSKQNYLGEVVWIKDFNDLRMVAGSFGNYITMSPNDDNLFISGELQDTLIIVGEETLYPNENSEGYFIAKFDTEGNYKWAKQEKVKCNELCLRADYSGNIVLSGTFYITDTIGNKELICEGDRDIFISKYDKDGNFIWAKRAGGEYTDWFGFISVDGEDNVFLAGEFISENVTVDETEITLKEGDGNLLFSKLNSDGSVQWIKSYAGIENSNDNGWPEGMITDKFGYSYIKGMYQDSATFGDTVLSSPYGIGFSTFITKINPEGEILWANSIHNYKFIVSTCQIDNDKNGDVYFGGNAVSGDTLYFGSEFIYPSTEDDAFITKYNSMGELKWVKTMVKSYGRLTSAAVWDTSFVYVGGDFKYSINIGGDIFKSESVNGFVALIGNDINDPEIETCASDTSITLDENEQLIIPDLTDRIISFDDFTNDTNLIVTQNPESGIYINSGDGTMHEVVITVEDEEGNTKTCTVVITGSIKTGIENFSEDESNLIIYPNPSSDKIQINFENRELNNIELKLYDLQGRMILTKTSDKEGIIAIYKSEVKKSGIYIFKINDNRTGKIIFN